MNKQPIQPSDTIVSDNKATIVVENLEELHKPAWRRALQQYITKNRYMLIMLVVGVISILTGYIVQQKPLQPPQASVVAPSSLLLVPTSASTHVGSTVIGSIFIVPQTNTVYGTDISLAYDPTFLKLDSITPNSQSTFGTIKTSVDQFSGTITITALAYRNGQPQPAVSNTEEIAKFTFSALQETAATNVRVVHTAGSSTDSNIVVASGTTVSDALENTPKALSITINAPPPGPSPTPTVPPPGPSPTPTVPPPGPSPTPTVPPPGPSPTPTVPPPGPSPTPTVPPPQGTEIITVTKAVSKRFFWKYYTLSIKAQDTWAPSVGLTASGYGTLHYSNVTGDYSRLFFINHQPSTVTIVSSLGTTVTVPVIYEGYPWRPFYKTPPTVLTKYPSFQTESVPQ